MRLTFVTGVSCAGKTTVGEAMSGLTGVNVRDLDGHAPARPATAWLDWLRWRAAEELQRATDMATGEPDVAPRQVVVTGIVWPFRVVESPAWEPARKAGVRVEFLMLDPRWRVLRERLSARLADKPKAERRDTLAYNRDLRSLIRRQVRAVQGGMVLRTDASAIDIAAMITFQGRPSGWLGNDNPRGDL